MTQAQAVIETIDKLGGIATLNQINQHIFEIKDCLHLPSSVINEALDEIDEATYMDNLRQLALSRRKDAPEKRLRFLLQRGFTYEEIKKCT